MKTLQDERDIGAWTAKYGTYKLRYANNEIVGDKHWQRAFDNVLEGVDEEIVDAVWHMANRIEANPPIIAFNPEVDNPDLYNLSQCNLF